MHLQPSLLLLGLLVATPGIMAAPNPMVAPPPPHEDGVSPILLLSTPDEY
jgi:hypothetical protein